MVKVQRLVIIEVCLGSVYLLLAAVAVVQQVRLMVLVLVAVVVVLYNTDGT